MQYVNSHLCWEKIIASKHCELFELVVYFAHCNDLGNYLLNSVAAVPTEGYVSLLGISMS